MLVFAFGYHQHTFIFICNGKIPKSSPIYPNSVSWNYLLQHLWERLVPFRKGKKVMQLNRWSLEICQVSNQSLISPISLQSYMRDCLNRLYNVQAHVLWFKRWGKGKTGNALFKGNNTDIIIAQFCQYMQRNIADHNLSMCLRNVRGIQII